MKELLTALSKAKQEIKNTNLKKAGYNDYSNYSYWTPEQVEKLVNDACINNNLLTLFSLIRDEFGEIGILTIVHIDSGQETQLKMATAIPQITATNAAQQLGGCMTYTERYLKMSAFGVHENDLDPDSKDNSKPKNQSKDKTDDKPWLNIGTKEWNGGIEKGTSLDVMKKYFKVSKANSDEYTKQLNAKKP